MRLYLYNTLSRKKEAFKPYEAGHVKLYVCGPTVYDTVHLGNARSVMVFDVLYRLLQLLFPKVTYVRNITDIDDKIIHAAREKGLSIQELTVQTTAKFHKDMAELNVLSPTHEPRATAYVGQMINLIQDLIDKGFAYAADGHVLFHVSSFPAYGKLSGCQRDDMIAGARVEVAPYKKDPADFVLWKPSDVAQDVPGWDSPWGIGRPGWHIECSAMSAALLGVPFDIHGGGQDLIFPHHENEVAQSCAAHDTELLARYWMHNGILTVNGEKMSKSLGNFLTVDDLLKTTKSEVFRFVILSTHYRQALDWTEQAVQQAHQSLDRLYNTLRLYPAEEEQGLIDSRFKEALLDDMNTPLAIAVLHNLASTIHKSEDKQEKKRLAATLKASAATLGLLQQDPMVWFQGDQTHDAPIHALIQQRQEARDQKNFKEADRLRALLTAQGIVLEDEAQGTTWRRV